MQNRERLRADARTQCCIDPNSLFIVDRSIRSLPLAVLHQLHLQKLRTANNHFGKHSPALDL